MTQKKFKGMRTKAIIIRVVSCGPLLTAALVVVRPLDATPSKGLPKIHVDSRGVAGVQVGWSKC